MKEAYKGLERIFELKRQKRLNAVGKLFSTENNSYFYDTGTSKVILLDDFTITLLNRIYDDNSCYSLDELCASFECNVQNLLFEWNEIVEKEKLFAASKLISLKTEGYESYVKNELNQKMNQIILELTGMCNLRCGYCIYNDDFKLNRGFNCQRMSVDTAKAAINYLNAHGGEKVSVTFYGGEPLLEYDLLKWCIEYSQKTILNKEVHFSFTTNLTLMTQERAKYLASVDNLSIVCSIDGPEYVHDAYRRKIDGSGSFQEAITGLKILVKEFGNKSNRISINGVFAPPYTYEKLEDITKFYKSLDWLPKDIQIDLGYASDDTVDDSEHIKQLSTNKEYCTRKGAVNPLLLYEKKAFLDKGETGPLGNNIIPDLLHIHKRRIFNIPIDVYIFNGCCIPGARRLYVNTEGKFYICERIGISPEIGDVKEGINWNSVYKHYILEYAETLTPLCRNCWAIRLCKRCYARSYKKDGMIDQEKLERSCESIRHLVENELELYHSILEQQPDKLDNLNKMELH